MPETTPVRPGQTKPKPIPADADLRVLFVAALLRNGGDIAFLHEEIGEAAIASFNGTITVEHEHEGAVFRLVQDADSGQGT